MPSCLLPLSEVPAGPVKQYLERQGITPEIIDWKYFDNSFNRGAGRGYTLLRDGRVSGFLGAIPFTMWVGGKPVRTAWSCDWSCDPDAGAAGLLLIKRMLDLYDPYFQLGGNENTLRIMPRVAAFSALETGILMYVPLRLGALLRRLKRRMHGIPLDAAAILNRLPISISPWERASRHIRIEPGVSPALSSLVSEPRQGKCFPQYDFDHVNWQIGRCPAVEAVSIFVPSPTEVPAAALCWREKPKGAEWRLALWSAAGAGRELESVIASAVRHAYRAGGEMISTLVSRVDTELITLLTSKHFLIAPKRRMFCVVASAKDRPFEEPSGLSLLDTDMAYRF